ncbi:MULTISPECIES: hypothetical protein [Klebsiella pneumoniae complex]|uniref:hypothetical protein n=1 Tax=Klebsiella pneumoniae complex TaxID=3390273 RepID=UPI000E3B8859
MLLYAGSICTCSENFKISFCALLLPCNISAGSGDRTESSKIVSLRASEKC